MNKKPFTIAAICMVAAALAFVAVALCNPQLSFPWSNDVTYGLYAAYAALTLFVFLFPRTKGAKVLNAVGLLADVVAIFFLTRSLCRPEGSTDNVNLSLALLFVCIGLFSGIINRRLTAKREKADKEARQ